MTDIYKRKRSHAFEQSEIYADVAYASGIPGMSCLRTFRRGGFQPRFLNCSSMALHYMEGASGQGICLGLARLAPHAVW